MLEGTGSGKAVGRVINIAGQDDVVGKPDAATAEHVPYSELPDRSRKWPKPLRVLFIAGSAAALWGAIFVAFKAF